MVSTSDVIVEQSTVVNTEKVEPVITDEEFEKAQKIFQQGKKNLLLNKFDEAVNNIGDACKSYSTKFGEISENCAEVYYFYGKALLELARVENTVLGNALNGVPEDTEPINDSRYGNPEDVKDEEKKEISDQVIEAMCEEKTPETEPTSTETPTETPATTEATPAAETLSTTTEMPAATTETPATTTEIPATTTETPATTTETTTELKEDEEEADDDGEEAEEDDEDDEDLAKNDEQIKDEAEADDISNLQRAWEMFELAKLIYNKHFNDDLVFKHKRIAECLLKLGEISVEQELYEQAVIDITESVKFQEEYKERDERMLAESFYQLGLAYQFNNQFSESNESFKKSTNILQLRIDKLKGMIESTSDDLEKNSFKDEITELETLLPEMLAKLEEVSEQGQQSINLIKEAKECFLNSMEKNGTATTTTTSSDAEVKDITSLVKSKRKISASSEPVASFKKTKTEDGGEVETTTTTTASTEETTAPANTESAMETEVPKTTEMPAAPAPIEAN